MRKFNAPRKSAERNKEKSGAAKIPLKVTRVLSAEVYNGGITHILPMGIEIKVVKIIPRINELRYFFYY